MSIVRRFLTIGLFLPLAIDVSAQDSNMLVIGKRIELASMPRVVKCCET